MVKFKILHFVLAPAQVLGLQSLPRVVIIRWPNVGSQPSRQTHDARRRMPKEAGADHQHIQSCVAIPVTDPDFAQGTYMGVIAGREDDR